MKDVGFSAIVSFFHFLFSIQFSINTKFLLYWYFLCFQPTDHLRSSIIFNRLLSSFIPHWKGRNFFLPFFRTCIFVVNLFSRSNVIVGEPRMFAWIFSLADKKKKSWKWKYIGLFSKEKIIYFATWLTYISCQPRKPPKRIVFFLFIESFGDGFQLIAIYKCLCLARCIKNKMIHNEIFSHLFRNGDSKEMRSLSLFLNLWCRVIFKRYLR